MMGGKSSINDYDIKIDKEGVWFFRGAEMFRKDFVYLFYQHVKKDEAGRYFIEFGPETTYLDVEDTAFVVKNIYKVCSPENGEECIEMFLSDGTFERLDPKSIYVGKDNVLYCLVKENKFEARFLRPSYYQITEFIEYDDANDEYFISLNDQKYCIELKDK